MPRCRTHGIGTPWSRLLQNSAFKAAKEPAILDPHPLIMIKQLLTLLACLLCVFDATGARADDSSLRATFQARYAAMKTAMAERDSKAMAALLAPGFVSIDSSGKSESASQMIQEVDGLPKDPLKVSTTTLLSIKVAGNSAVVDQRYDMKTVKTAADSSKVYIQLITVSTDTWVNVNGVWLLQKTETNQLDYYKNGQLLAHKVNPQP